MEVVNFLLALMANFFTTLYSAPMIPKVTYFANQTACFIDGKIYGYGEIIPSEHPCEMCRCRPPGFSCSLKNCPVKQGCRPIEIPGQCCPEYDCGCIYNGKVYHESQRIPHSPTPCVTCYCRSNIVRCGFNECKFRFDCEPEYVPGQCCPRYDHCDNLIKRFKSINESDSMPSMRREEDGDDDGNNNNNNNNEIKLIPTTASTITSMSTIQSAPIVTTTTTTTIDTQATTTPINYDISSEKSEAQVIPTVTENGNNQLELGSDKSLSRSDTMYGHEIGTNHLGSRKKKLITHFIEPHKGGKFDNNLKSNQNYDNIKKNFEYDSKSYLFKPTQQSTIRTIDSDIMETLPSLTTTPLAPILVTKILPSNGGYDDDEIVEISTEEMPGLTWPAFGNNQRLQSEDEIQEEKIPLTTEMYQLTTTQGTRYTNQVNRGYVQAIYRGTIGLLSNILARFG
ncbi:uncharacterized protein LOC141855336 [Brevipalpus obovatus]|uniref:uncharacterized protein LOC141855336 n=1 Tax=Brevipalpus obovatus TaxID=246614 RepID=UPI003D9E68A9